MTVAAATPQKNKGGRPKTRDTVTLAPAYETALYRFLQTSLPQFVIRGRLNVRKLAAAAQVAPQTLYAWLQANRLTSTGAAAILEAGKDSLKPEDLVEFVIQS